jgi:hypothetical protein
LTLAGRLPEQDVLGADVFIEIGPMNTLALTDQTPIVALLRLAVQQPWVPSQRNGDRSPVNQVNHQRVLGHDYVLHRGSPRLNQ